MRDRVLRNFPWHVAVGVLAAALFVMSGMPVSAHDRPLGDDRISAEPRQAYLMSCQIRFIPNAPDPSTIVAGDRPHVGTDRSSHLLAAETDRSRTVHQCMRSCLSKRNLGNSLRRPPGYGCKTVD